MKLKLTSKVKEEKTFNYVLHTLHFTEVNILDYLLIKDLFINTDWDTSPWDELMQNVESASIPHIKNIKKDSFNIEIDDYYDILDLLQQFLTDNDLQYEI
jgi:hypothetical protein